MKRLPLYKKDKLEVEYTKNPCNPDPKCRSCSLWATSKRVCVPDAGAAVGGVLVVGGQPTYRNVQQDPFSSGAEGKARKKIDSYGKPTTYTYAIKCAGVPDGDTVDACRKYLLNTLQELKPERVILLGKQAAESFTGRSYNATILRRGYVTSYDGTPVFFLEDPNDVARNLVHKKWWLQDLEWVMSADPPVTPYDGDVYIVETLKDAQKAVESIKAKGSDVVFDTETYGQMFDPNFKIVCLAATYVDEDADVAWVWPEEALVEGDPRREHLVELLKDCPAWGHNVKYDVNTVKAYLGVDVAVAGCTLTAAKLQKMDGQAGLNMASNMVGMGGHKARAKEAEAIAVHALNLLRSARDKDVPNGWKTVERVDKRGRKSRRKVVDGTHPPSLQEKLKQVDDAWRKERAVAGGKPKQSMATYFGLFGVPMPDDWLEAALSNHDPMSFIFGLIDRQLCMHYCALDTIATSRLVEHTRRVFDETEETKQIKVAYEQVMVPAIGAVARIEQRGLLVDMDALDVFESFLDEKITQSLAGITEYAPDLNPASRPQLAQLLYGSKCDGGLGLPVPGITKKGLPSTKAEFLEKIRDAHPVVGHLLEYAEVSKLQSNYARGLREFIREDGRVHCTFNMTGAETGRFSCSAPNAQTLPSRGQYAKMAKSLFITPPGYSLVQYDYRTLEVRVAALLSQCPKMLEVLADPDLDFHTAAAEGLSKVVWGNSFTTCGLPTETEDDIAALAAEQKRRRGITKTTVFGVLYGQGVASTAQKLNILEAEAAAAQNGLFGTFKGLHKWVKETIRNGKRDGGVWTWWDGRPARFRPLSEFGYERDNKMVSQGSRRAVNSRVQGTGSDFNTASIGAIDRWIIESGIAARLNLAVHDSILAEVRDDAIPEYCYNVERIMQSHNSMGLPIPVDREVGKSYGAMGKYALDGDV